MSGGVFNSIYSKGSSGGSSGAPTDATYITQTPNSTLTNEQALSTLATGILKSTTGTGVVSIAVAGTDFAPATSGTAILKGSGAGGFSAAVSGTDYAPATSGTSVLKGNGSGGFSAAVANTDFLAVASPTFTGTMTGDIIRTSGASGVAIQNSAGTQVALFGAAAGTGISLNGTTNIGSASADFFQVSGGIASAAITASGSSSNIAVNISSKGTSPISAITGGGEQFRVANTASANNYWQITGGTTAGTYITSSAQGSDSNIGMQFTSKGSGGSVGSFIFDSGANNRQMAILHTASANRYVTVTGSNGGAPVVDTSSGALQLSSAGQAVLQLQGTASTALNLYMASAASGGKPIFGASGATNTSLGVYSNGTGSLDFHTGGGRDGAQQFRVSDTVGANRFIIATGSNGGNPLITTSGGDLNLTSATGTVLVNGSPLSAFAWGATATGTSGTGVALTVGNSASAGTIAQSITIGNTQSNTVVGLQVETGTSVNGRGVYVNASGTTRLALVNIASLSSGGLAPFSGASIHMGQNWNNIGGSNTWQHIRIENLNHASGGSNYNTGISISNSSTSWQSVASGFCGEGSGIVVTQSGAGGTAITAFGSNNVNTNTNGLNNTTLSNTQSGASTLYKADMGTSAQAHTAYLATATAASTTATAFSADLGSTGLGRGVRIQGTSTSHNQAYFSLTPTVSGSSLTARSTAYFEIDSSRTETRTTGTTADTANFAAVIQRLTMNGAGGTLTNSQATLYVVRTLTQTAGTITDTGPLLTLDHPSTIGTGGHIRFINSPASDPTTNGVFWWDGTVFKYRSGGVVRTITAT